MIYYTLCRAKNQDFAVSRKQKCSVLFLYVDSDGKLGQLRLIDL